MLTAASCFSGIGAPELGGSEFDWRWSAEFDKSPARMLAARFPNVPNLGDVTADDFIARAHARGPLDLLVGGPPCQAFSFAGLRKSLGDDRGNLSLRFVEIAHAIRPRNLLVENVPGWLSTADNAFGCFLGAIVGGDAPLSHPTGKRWPDIGMVAGPLGRAAWRVLDAQYFGLAQRRKRVFVVVDFGNGADPARVLFERRCVHGSPRPRRAKGAGFTHDVAPSLTRSGRGVERTGESRGQDPLVAVAYDLRGREGGAQFEGPHDTANLRSASGGSSRSYVVTRRSVRRLTPVECERLQGFPDGFTLVEGNSWRKVSPEMAAYLRAQGGDVVTWNDGTLRTRAVADGPRYKALGNSWAVKCGRWIISRLAAELDRASASADMSEQPASLDTLRANDGEFAPQSSVDGPGNLDSHLGPSTISKGNPSA